MPRNYWEVWWSLGGYAHNDIPRIFEWICRNVYSPSGSPLIDCYDKYGPTETKYETKFHPNETWRDYQRITFNIRRIREISERDSKHTCVAKVTIIRRPLCSTAQVYIQSVYKGRYVRGDYQPKPPQTDRIYQLT